MNDEQAEDIKPDLLAEPNFPGIRMKPKLPTRVLDAPVITTPVGRAYKTADHDGAMVAVRIPLVSAKQIAVPGGEPAEDLHVTLVYLGDADQIDSDARKRLHDALARVCAHEGPIEGTVRGYGRFRNGEEDALWAGFDSPELPELRHKVLQACRDAGVEPAGDHGFTPHITLAYVGNDEGEDAMPPEVDVEVKGVSLCIGGDEVWFKLKGSDSKRDDKAPQETLPEETVSVVMQPAGPPFTKVSQLEEWAQDKGDLVVRAVADGLPAVFVKKGSDAHFAVQGWDAPIRLDDLMVALRRIDHDVVITGTIAAKDLSGKWRTGADLAPVFTADEVAMPVFFPTDLLVLDGDLTQKGAAERWELLRSLVPIVGSHVIVPMQVVCKSDEELDAAVDEVAGWKPSEGDGLGVKAVACLRADSPYAHGPSDDMAVLSLTQTAKVGWTDEAREAAVAARGGKESRAVANMPLPRSGASGFINPDGTVRFTPEQAAHDTLMRPGEDWGNMKRTGHVRFYSIPDGAGVEYNGDPSKNKMVAQLLDKVGSRQVFVDRGGKAYHYSSGFKAAASVRANFRGATTGVMLSADAAELAVAEKLEKEFGFGVGPGPGEPPDWMDHVSDEKLKPNFLHPEKGTLDPEKGMLDDGTDPTDAGNPPKKKDAFTTDGAAGILAPGQGVFRQFARGGVWDTHNAVFFKDGEGSEGDNFSVGVPLTFVSSNPKKKPKADNRDPGGPLFPHYPRPEGGGSEGTAAGYLASLEKFGDGGQGGGDGDSFAVGYGAVGGHRFVVGTLKDGMFVEDPEFKRVNPYEAIFQRKCWVGVREGVSTSALLERDLRLKNIEDEQLVASIVGQPGLLKRAVDAANKAAILRKDRTGNPDARKPRKYPDVGEDMGFNDSYYSLVKVAKAGRTVAIDFDGTCTVGENGEENPKVRKLVQALYDAGADVVVFTARDLEDVKDWLADKKWPALEVTNQKSPNFQVMLDDRAVHFDPKDVPSPDELLGFKAWWEKSADDSPRVPRFSRTVDMVEDGVVVVRHTFYGDDEAVARHMERSHRQADASLDAALKGEDYRGVEIDAVRKMQPLLSFPPARVRKPQETSDAPSATGTLFSAEKDSEGVMNGTEEYSTGVIKVGWTDEAREAAREARDRGFERAGRAAERTIVEAGGQYNGIQHTEGFGHEHYALVTEPTTGSTGMIPLNAVTPETVRAKLDDIKTRVGKEAASITAAAQRAAELQVTKVEAIVQAESSLAPVVEQLTATVEILKQEVKAARKPRKVRKTIIRDADMRPTGVVEEEIA
jgi:hypothetical protein